MHQRNGCLEGFRAASDNFTADDADRAFLLMREAEHFPAATNSGWRACGSAAQPGFCTEVSLEGRELIPAGDVAAETVPLAITYRYDYEESGLALTYHLG